MNNILPFKRPFPNNLSSDEALEIIREIAADSKNVAILNHCKERMQQRGVSRRQIDLCIQKGTVSEGPFMNPYGNWQVSLFRHAAGEQVTCVIAIEWDTRLLVVTVY